MSKMCPRCAEVKPDSDFSRRGSKLQSYCSECNKKYKNEWYNRNKSQVRQNTIDSRKRNQRYVFDYLSRNPCVDCGESDPIVLELDHVRGDKLSAVSTLVRNGFSTDSIDEEILKCEVRCANCHKRATAIRAGYWYISTEPSDNG